MKRILISALSLATLGLAVSCDAGEVRRADLPMISETFTPPAAEPSSPTPRPSSPATERPRFSASISEIDGPTRTRMSSSWRVGCPVALSDLRLLRLTYWGFDDSAHRGEMVVHEDVSHDVIRVFEELFDARFPIRRVRLVDEYGGDDGRSMAANNTSAFNCRRSTGDPSAWSEHAHGRAIDINPVQNPYVSSSGTVEPDAGRAFADRSRTAPGMIRSGGVVVRAFRAIGWGWGGTWQRSKDYQHFSQSGR